jgi:hypothetical protein
MIPIQTSKKIESKQTAKFVLYFIENIVVKLGCR